MHAAIDAETLSNLLVQEFNKMTGKGDRLLYLVHLHRLYLETNFTYCLVVAFVTHQMECF
jgi:hypothetical protein